MGSKLVVEKSGGLGGFFWLGRVSIEGIVA